MNELQAIEIVCQAASATANGHSDCARILEAVRIVKEKWQQRVDEIDPRLSVTKDGMFRYD